MLAKKFFVTFLMLTFSIQAIEVEQKEIIPMDQEGPPWLTGPLLSPSANVVPVGSFNFQPYLYLTGYTGAYNGNWEPQEIPFFWTYSFQFNMQFGIAPRVDLVLAPIFYYDECEWQKSWVLGDTPIKIEFQIYKESKYLPAVKIGIQESFPSGRYRNLNPKKLQTDAGGTGSYVSSIGMTMGKLIQIRGIHYLSARLGFSCDIPSSVYVTGFNTYGGDSSTKGTYYPPQAFNAFIGLEYSLTKKWALAFDAVYTCTGASRFKGITGLGSSRLGTPGSPVLSPGSLPSNTLAVGPSAQISLAPAIEYNWSQYWGVIAGAWFTVAGKNSSEFQSGVISVNYFK